MQLEEGYGVTISLAIVFAKGSALHLLADHLARTHRCERVVTQFFDCSRPSGLAEKEDHGLLLLPNSRPLGHPAQGFATWLGAVLSPKGHGNRYEPTILLHDVDACAGE